MSRHNVDTHVLPVWTLSFGLQPRPGASDADVRLSVAVSQPLRPPVFRRWTRQRFHVNRATRPSKPTQLRVAGDLRAARYARLTHPAVPRAAAVVGASLSADDPARAVRRRLRRVGTRRCRRPVTAAAVSENLPQTVSVRRITFELCVCLAPQCSVLPRHVTSHCPLFV